MTISGGAFGDPSAEAFDGSGDLWVANFTHGSVVEYTGIASQLASTGARLPP